MSHKRTDCHRPGAIVPRDYAYSFSYILPGAEPWDQWNMDVVRALGEAHAYGRNGTLWGRAGKCGICGAAFRYGDVWTHVPTGHVIHVGRDCAEKYTLLAERPDFNAALEMLERKRAAFLTEQKNKAAREAFCARHPGLAEDLALGCEDDVSYGSRTLLDLGAKLDRFHDLSPAQVAFARKLALEMRSKAARPAPAAERHVPAPVSEKRQTLRGILLSKKSQEGQYGVAIKGTIKVTAPDGGVWLAWGTLPDSVLGGTDPVLGTPGVQVGDTIELTVTLDRVGDQPHFAFYRRPTGGKILARAAARHASFGREDAP
jgi:hypothetical protein